MISATVLFALFREDAGFDRSLYFPFLSAEKYSFVLPLAIYVPFAVIVVAGTSNAVNLTDGLDGLAIGPVMVATLTFMILAYCGGTVLNLRI